MKSWFDTLEGFQQNFMRALFFNVSMKTSQDTWRFHGKFSRTVFGSDFHLLNEYVSRTMRRLFVINFVGKYKSIILFPHRHSSVPQTFRHPRIPEKMNLQSDYLLCHSLSTAAQKQLATDLISHYQPIFMSLRKERSSIGKLGWWHNYFQCIHNMTSLRRNKYIIFLRPC